MQMVIGITGGIASGKSTVSPFISSLGCTVVDADVASRKVMEPGEEAYQQVKDAFGESVFKEDGNLNRETLGAIIFHNKEKRQLLNSIVHPAVRKWMNTQQEEAFARGEEVVFVDIPLLFESKLTSTVNRTLLVYVDDDVQLARLMERNDFSKEEALARIQSQMPLVEKKKLADEVINNNGTIEDTKKQLLDILRKWHIRVKES